MTAPLTLAALDAYRRIVTEADTRPVVSVPLTPGDIFTLLDIAEDHARLSGELDAAQARLEAIRCAVDAYRANPINAYDTPTSWDALESLLDACEVQETT